MWLIVVLLILAGLALLIVEVVFIPGTTVVGVIGLVMTVAGVIFGYSAFGNTIGSIILASTAVSSGVLFYYAFRTNAWDRFALKNSINSKNNEGFLESFTVGEEGICLSALRPMGKAEFNNRAVEVSSLGDYVDTGARVRIKEVTPSRIIVEQIP